MNNEKFEKQSKQQEEATDLLKKLETNEWLVGDEAWKNRHSFSAAAPLQEELDKKKLVQEFESIKPEKYEQIKNKVATISYIQGGMDKLIAEINTRLVTKLNSALTEEKSKVEKLITDVGDSDSGLIKSLNDLQSRVQTLEEDKVGGDIWG